MNRLVITILLVLAFAVSFARFAFAGDSANPGPAPARHHLTAAEKAAKDAAKTADASSTITTAAATNPATPTQLAKVDSASISTAPTIQAVCGTDKDCISKKLGDGKEIVNSVEESDGTRSMVGTVNTEACNCAFTNITPQKMAIPKSAKPEELKIIAQQLDDKLKEAYATYLKETKYEIDTCQIDETTKAAFVKPVLKKSKDEAVDYSSLALKDLDPIADCLQTKIKDLENSKDPKEIEALNSDVKQFEKRRWAGNKPGATDRARAAATLMGDFEEDVIANNDTLNEIAAPIIAKNLKAFGDTLMANIQLAAQYLAAHNPAAAAQLLQQVKIDKATFAQEALRAGTTLVADSDNKQYMANIAAINTTLRSQSDLDTAMAGLTKAISSKSSTSSGIGGIYTNAVAQILGTSDKSLEKSFDDNLKTAGHIAERCENGDCGGLNASVFLKEPASAQCFAAGNCTGLNSAPHWKLGTGQLASQSATNYNTPMNQVAAGSNSLTRSSPNGFSAGRNM